MRYYEYDAQGWLVGLYDAVSPRPNSTAIAPTMPGVHARWNGSAWTTDTSRETQQTTDEQAARDRLQQAIDILRAYDHTTATAADVRVAVGALIEIVKRIYTEIQE